MKNSTRNQNSDAILRASRPAFGLGFCAICFFVLVNTVAGGADGENAYVTIVHPDGTRTRYSLPADPSPSDRGDVLRAAKSDSKSGDTIVVGPGTAEANNLLKDGVNWHFMTGATIVRSSSSGAAIFDDYASHGADGPATAIITGDGKFDGGAGSAIFLRWNEKTGSNVSFNADSITSAGNTIVSRGATLNVKANVINSTGPSAVWWYSGPMHVQANEIMSPGNATVYSTAPSGEPEGYLWVQANLIKNTSIAPSTTNKAVWFHDQEPSAREWIQALQIQGPIAINTSTSGSVNYVRAEKIFGQINHSVGSLYIDAQKISDDGLNGNLINLSGGNSWLNILQVDDTGLPTAPLVAPAAIVVSGGTHYFRGNSLTRTVVGDGITVSGGALTVSGLSISTQSEAYDLARSGGTLTVLGCGYATTKTSGVITQGDPHVSSAPGYGVGPATPADGSTYQLFLNTSDHRIYGWNGSSWVPLDN